MPKLKTNRAAAKRFKKTATGKIKRTVAGKQHILTKKTQKMKRRLRKASLLDSANTKAAKRMLIGEFIGLIIIMILANILIEILV